MKNKNLQQVQLGLIDQLLDSVNSKQEFNYLEAEKQKFSSFFSHRIERRCA